MGNMLVATIFIVVANLLMWFSGLAMADVNPNFQDFCYSAEDTIIGNTLQEQENLTMLDNSVVDKLPVSEGSSIISGAVSFFTDIFNNVLGWFKTSLGLNYVVGVVGAPYNMLKCMNLPTPFVAGIGTLWYLISLLVLVTFMWGRG